jgi:hypothetical protein
MSFAEIKVQVAELSDEERLELQGFLYFLRVQNDPEHLAELDRRMADMDAGKKFSQEDVERLHRELMEQGR